VLVKILKRTSNRYQNNILWEWLDSSFTPKELPIQKLLIKNDTEFFQINSLKGTSKAPALNLSGTTTA